MRPALGARSSLAAALFCLSVSGCIVENQNHCANQSSKGPTSGDDYCSSQHGENYICTDGTCAPDQLEERTGCAPEAKVPDACHCPQGGCNVGNGETSDSGDGDGDATTSTGDGDSTDTSGDGDSAETMTTSTTSMGDGDEGPECTEVDAQDDACGADDDAIFCMEGSCVDCSAFTDGDAICEAYNADTPNCVGTTCVECGEDADCPSDNPVCGDDNTCGPCNAHASCPDSACNLETGGCMDADPVIYVNGQSGSDDTGDGTTPGTAFATIQYAIDSVSALGTATVVVESVAADYVEVVSVQGKTIALIGQGSPELIGNGGSGLSLLSGATVFVDGFTIRGATFEGINCSGPTLWVDNTIVYNNGTDGVSVGSSCSATLRNVMISGHTGLGQSDNEVNNTGDLTMAFSTVVGVGNGEPSLACSGGTTSVTNSILLSETADSEACAGATFENTAMNNSANAGLGSTENVGALMPSWFSNFGTGDLHLAGDGSSTPFGGLAVLGADDLATDIDGEARPAMGFVGADEP